MPPLQGTLLRKLGDTQWRSSHHLQAPAFSPDGKTLAFGGVWNLSFWQFPSGKHLRDCRLGGCGYFWSVAFAPDGNLYAAGQHHNVMRWDPHSGKLVQEYAWHKSVIRKISLSKDGTLLASMDVTKKVAIWEVPKGTLVRTWDMPSTSTWPDIALSPDGQWLATSGTREEPVLLFDVKTGAKKRAFADGANPHGPKLAFTPDGKRLVSGEQGPIFVWDVDTGKLVHRWKNPSEDHVEALAISPDGKFLATVGWGETMHVWNLGAAKLERSLTAPGERLFGVAFSPDSATLVAGGERRAIHRWRVADGELLTQSPGHTAGVEGALWLSAGKVLTAGLDRSVRLWDADNGKLEKTVALRDGVFPKAFTPDGALMLGRSDFHLHLVDTATGKEIERVEARVDWNAQPALSADGKLVAYPVQSKELHVRAVGAGQPARILPGPGRLLYALCFSPDGKHLAAGFEQKYKEPFERIGANDVLKPRTSLKESTILLYDVQSGKEIAKFGEDLPAVVHLAYSPDGRFLAVGDQQNTVHVWDLLHRKKLTSSLSYNSSPTLLVFSPDSRRLLTLGRMSGTGFEMLEIASMTRVAHFKGHQGQTAVLAFSPDGRRIASGGLDTLALVWDATAFTPDGTLPKDNPTDVQLDEWWEQLGSRHAAQANAPLWRLVAAGERGITFLKSKLKPVPRVDAKKVTAWLDQIDDAQFSVREDAYKQLERLGDAIEEDVRKGLERPVSLEAQRRFQRLLDKLGPTPDRLRVTRSLMILEQVGAPARPLLEALAQGEPRAALTRDAGETLNRLQKK
ncbi:MAG: WD40 repeat domain-containing protein [Gemmataceae bacterium]|nr:WD40 repeat domain-containing protein [Gemmataceae bacterium]MCI0737844.1 WD40 repeat domain-containing protein [Gemmataceae bacterium]